MNLFFLKKQNLLIVSPFLFFFLFLGLVSAQSVSEPIITWRADGFSPSDYLGKILPSPGTRVSLSVALLKGNKLYDLSGVNIFWYLDEKLILRGSSAKTSFVASKPAGSSHFVRVAIENSDGRFENSIRIPVVRPKVVVSVPVPNNSVEENSEIRLKALPLFFNISSVGDLKFSWSSEENKVSGSSNELLLKVGSPRTDSQRSLLIGVVAENIKNPLEAAQEILKLYIY